VGSTRVPGSSTVAIVARRAAALTLGAGLLLAAGAPVAGALDPASTDPAGAPDPVQQAVDFVNEVAAPTGLTLDAQPAQGGVGLAAGAALDSLALGADLAVGTLEAPLNGIVSVSGGGTTVTLDAGSLFTAGDERGGYLGGLIDIQRGSLGEVLLAVGDPGNTLPGLAGAVGDGLTGDGAAGAGGVALRAGSLSPALADALAGLGAVARDTATGAQVPSVPLVATEAKIDRVASPGGDSLLASLRHAAGSVLPMFAALGFVLVLRRQLVSALHERHRVPATVTA
jgi:hypothetical protein